jgi:hypothetical protein
MRTAFIVARSTYDNYNESEQTCLRDIVELRASVGSPIQRILLDLLRDEFAELAWLQKRVEIRQFTPAMREVVRVSLAG